MYHFICEASFFNLLTCPVPRLSPQERAAFRRVSPPSTSPPLSPLPLSWKAFTRVHWAHWAPWQTVGPWRGERGFSEDLPPYALDPYASARDRGDGWESGPKPFKPELFCPCSSCLPAAFSSWWKCATLHPFFHFIFSIPIGKTALTILPFCSEVGGDASSPLLSLHLHVNWRHFLHAETAFIPYRFSAVFCTFASTSLWNLGGSSKHHPD